jgi:hypothetical protein
MSNLVPSHVNPSAPARSMDRAVSRQLSGLERETIISQARVHAAGVVQTAKLDEVDRLSRTAMSGQALLARWSAVLADGDAFVADDLKLFTELAKMGKAEIIADTITGFSR